METTCQNCGQTITGKYCSNCGNIRELKKIDGKYVIGEFLGVVGFEKGITFTCKKLLTKPGETIRQYLTTNRQKIIKPIIFLALTSLIYTLISQFFKPEVVYSRTSKSPYGDSAVNDIMAWVMDNYGYSNLLMILPITLWTLLFFRKHKYNFYETFIIISYVMGMGMLMFSIEPIINKILPQAFIITETVVIIISFIYMSWAIGQVYKKKFKNYIKALFAYILGFFTFQIVVIIIGTSYDLMTKK